MAIAKTLRQFLDSHQAEYEVLTHPRAYTSMRTAEAAHVSGENMAKSVVVGDGGDYLLMVVPATHRVSLNRIQALRPRQARLASESEFAHLFRDCEVGAIPACGTAYGVPTIVDDALLACDDIYFEGGNHEELVHMSGAQFRDLMADVNHGSISRHR